MFDTFLFIWWGIFITIIISVVLGVATGTKKTKNIQNKIIEFTNTTIDNAIKNSQEQPQEAHCEYCGYTSKDNEKKCSCCGAPLKNKNVK